MYKTLAQKISEAIGQHGLPELLQTIAHYISDFHILDVEEAEESEILDDVQRSIRDAIEFSCKFETLHKTRYLFFDELKEFEERRAEARRKQEEEESAA